MNITKAFIALCILTTILSCNSNKIKNNQSNSPNDTLQTSTNKVTCDRTENLILSVADTIKKSTLYFFSNKKSKDLFLLTIEPGLVKNSKSSLQIITADNHVIYSQTFNTFYFIRLIYDPDTIPTTGGQEEYEKYMKNYAKSITPNQYETYFKKSVGSFFEALSFLDKIKLEELEDFGEINDKNFFNEYLSDTTIKLIDITCFDCDEGASVIGYSKKQKKVVTLLEHD